MQRQEVFITTWKKEKAEDTQQSFVYKDQDKQARCIPSRLISITYRQDMEAQQRKDKDTPFQLKREVEQDCNHDMAVWAMGSNSMEQGMKREKMTCQALFMVKGCCRLMKAVILQEVRLSWSHRSYQKPQCPQKPISTW